MNITDWVVKNDFCIGCGVCAAICPTNNLLIDWSTRGELTPFSSDFCKDNCSLCQSVCPFYDHEFNQNDLTADIFNVDSTIQKNEYIGYFLKNYIGHSLTANHRLKGSSGGMASWFMETLLKKQIVDRVVLVGECTGKSCLYHYRVEDTIEGVRSCSGSRYYPVEMSGILRNILMEKEDNKYAIIALPCMAYALRLAMKINPKLRNRIIVIASLTCGQLQNRFYTELLSVESGIPVNQIAKMDYRRQAIDGNALNYLQVPISKDGQDGLPQFNLQLPMHLWQYKFFTLNACSFCDDVFGECADVSFMDAWLPQYIKDSRGNSIIIARTSLVKKLLEKGIREGTCYLKEINPKSVITSQTGVIYKKRILIMGRLYFAKKIGLWYPKKRINEDKKIFRKHRKYIILTYKIQTISKEIWRKYREDQNTNRFWNDMKYLEKEIFKLEKKLKIKSYLGQLYRLLNFPLKYLNHFREVPYDKQ